MALEYKCEDCGKIKPWYSFPWDAQQKIDDKYGIACFRCSKDGVPKKRKLELFHITMRIDKLIYRAMNKNMADLRNALFDALEKVQSKQITVSEAKSVCDIAQTIINSVKVEVDYFKAIGAKTPSNFMQITQDAEISA